MPELREPAIDLYEAWQECRREWGPGPREDGFGLTPTDDTSNRDGFARWVARLRRAAGDEPGGEVPCLSWWIVEDVEIVGAAALRLGPDVLVSRVGHVGYGTRPSRRGRGFATWALDQVVSRAFTHGIDPVVLVCESDNDASTGTIVRRGGALVDRVTAHGVLLDRYRITAGGTLAPGRRR